MPLFGSSRDVSLFRKLNRELMGRIITQQCIVYKIRIEDTQVNIYGEASQDKFYEEPVIFNCLIERPTFGYSETDMGSDLNRNVNFRFFMDDLKEANIKMEAGDIILYQNSYYEVHNTYDNQYVVGKDPNYPNTPNPLSQDLPFFGLNLSVICETVKVPSDKVGISQERNE